MAQLEHQVLTAQEQGLASKLRYRMDSDVRDIKTNRVDIGPISG
jgi:hypothetical protein